MIEEREAVSIFGLYSVSELINLFVDSYFRVKAIFGFQTKRNRASSHIFVG